MNKVCMLLLMLSSVDVANAAESSEWIDKSFVFFFNPGAPTATDMSAESVKDFVESTVMGILPTGATLNKFNVGSTHGFVVHNINDDQFAAISAAVIPLGGVGTRNFIAKSNLQEEIILNKRLGPVSILPSQANGGCISRFLQFDPGMHGLDWLDLTRGDTTYCGPMFSDDKLDFFILDSGIEQANFGFAHTEVTVDDCFDPFQGPWTPNVDIAGWGTFHAGIAGSSPFGVTPRLRIHSIKVTNDQGFGSLESATCGFAKVFNWFAENPQKRAVVLLSFSFIHAHPEVDQVLSTIIQAYEDRIVVVSAAGDSSVDACTHSFSQAPEVINVGSVDILLQQSFFTDIGQCVHIFGSGESIVSTFINNGIAIGAGTGAAASQVAGVIAQYMLDNPIVTGLQIRQLITNNPPSPLYESDQVLNLSPNTPNKLIKYTCQDGCPATSCTVNSCSGKGLCFGLPNEEFCLCFGQFAGDSCESEPRPCTSMPCINGGCCTDWGDKYKCTCPAFTTGDRCEKPTCSTKLLDNLPNVHSCKRFYCCIQGKAYDLQCRKRNGVQFVFDTVSRTCKPSEEATTVFGCK